MIKENYKMLIIESDIDKTGMAGKVPDHLKANCYGK